MAKKVLFIFFLLITTVSFSQEKSISSLVATPNPFVTSTKISFVSTNKQNLIFSVRNVLGKTVYKKQITTVKGKNDIPFSKNNLQSGMYIYTIQNRKELLSKRFVIK